ncbi:MAG: enoyl-CoA hydratase/isomerase family protein [Desulfobacterales bacterium]|jgi:enoyl-CoA hydratase/carnithine racemase|nr:enoyl-CoA hydratase/isomerase family protein [Desulfobacterales bacterium]
MDYQTLIYEVQDDIGILTFNRPNRVNAVDHTMMDELVRFWHDRQEDYKARVIIIRGAGEKGFCSGFDVKQTSETGEGPATKEALTEHIYNVQARFSSVIRAMRTCPQPVIAAVHGPCMGAGLSFAMASDVRLASEDVMFCAQYINVGFSGADLGSSYFLWRIVGWGRAAEMCLTGSRVLADEAYRIGLVNHLYSREALFPAALEMAKNMTSKTRIGLRLTKDAFNAGLSIGSLEDANKIENRNQALTFLSGGTPVV